MATVIRKEERSFAPLVLGATSLVCWLWLAGLAGLPVAICGIVSSARWKRKGCLAMSIIGLALSVMHVIVFLVVVMADPRWQ